MSPAQPVTIDELRSCTMTLQLHMRGSGFSLLVRQCDQHPRLQQRVSTDKKAKTTTRHWIVDGEEFTTIEAALVRLNAPATEGAATA